MKILSREMLVLGHITLLMIACYLLVDSLTGLVLFEFGTDLKLSLIYKAPLILFVLLTLFMLNRKMVLLVVGGLLIFLIAPFQHIVQQGRVDSFFLDLSFSLKLLMPFIIFIYAYQLFRNQPFFHRLYATKIMLCLSLIVLLNLLLGLFGFGFHTYGEGESGLGISGYFYAGNELGGLLTICFAFLLQWVWLRNKLLYLPAALGCFLAAVMVATKSAVISAFLVSMLLPFVNERKLLFKLTRFKLAASALLLVILAAGTYALYEFLSSTALTERVLWAYQNFGFWGLIFSGRQDFVASSLAGLFADDSLFDLLFGIGVSGISLHTYKYSAEVDPVDTLVWFGLIGLFIVSAVAIFFTYWSFKKLADLRFEYAPAVLLANILLTALAFASGHIWTSGMLGIGWAMFNALLVCPNYPSSISREKMS